MYNSCALVSPTRGLIAYRKCHIPSINTEDTQVHETYYFEPGKILPVFELDNGTRGHADMLRQILPGGMECIIHARRQADICAYLHMGIPFRYVPTRAAGPCDGNSYVCRRHESFRQRADGGREEHAAAFWKINHCRSMGQNLACLNDEKWSIFRQSLIWTK